jgi:Regulator of chromosome condensation (RCC1) repeat.
MSHNPKADSDLYNWGRGKHGVFGNGSQADLKVPALNDTIKELREHNGIRITKLKACDNYTLALFGILRRNRVSIYKMMEAFGDGVTTTKDKLVADIESV